MVDRFQPKYMDLFSRTLIQFKLDTPTRHVELHAQLFETVNGKYKNGKKLQFEMSCFTRSNSLSIGTY